MVIVAQVEIQLCDGMSEILVDYCSKGFTLPWKVVQAR